MDTPYAARRTQIAGEIDQLQNRLRALKSEDRDLASVYPRPVQELAERLHEIGCQFDHTEHCAWHYDNKKPFALARGRARAAGRVEAAVAGGYTIEEINALLDKLPSQHTPPAGERKRAPSKAEQQLVDAMQHVFPLRFEGQMQWGIGWERREGQWRSDRLWSREAEGEHPWSGIQHRRYLAAARAWSKATGLEIAELARFTRLLNARWGWGA